jgi:hypothetical protein
VKCEVKKVKIKYIEIDFNFLAEIFNNQHGLCAYSGIPLNFGDCRTTNWVCSLERLNVYNGYTKENVCLVASEFNTGDQTRIYKEHNKYRGNCGWSKEKFEYFIQNIQP